MAKLNVTYPAVDVLVNGQAYRKVDRKAQAGDIVKATDSSTDIDRGAFYRVEVDSDGDLFFRDNAGDERYRFKGRIVHEVYEAVAPVSETANVELTFENVKYRKVDRSAREGDVIVFTEAPYGYLTSGKPYAVTEIDCAGDVQIADDDGDDYDTECDDFDVYEKVSAETYREVKRKAAVGERIKIVNTEDPRWVNGEEFVVERSEGSGVMVKHPRGHIGGCAGVFDSEYVVLEPVTSAEPSAEPVRLKVGDYAKVTGWGNVLLEVGDIVKLTAVTDGLSDAFDIADVLGNPIHGCKMAKNLTPATAEEFEEAKAEAQRKAAIGPFADGGFAQIIEGADGIFNANPGDYVTVKVTEDSGPYALQVSTEKWWCNYCNADALRQITEEEYNAAIAPKPIYPPVNVGDKIRITEYQCNWPVGTIAEVTKLVSAKTVRAYADGSTYLTDYGCFDVLTAEEVAAIEKEAQEAEEKRREELKWAAINRKVGEFKRGDIVEATHISSGDRLTGVVNDLERADSPNLGITSFVDGSYRAVYTEGASLIVPVEQRFDTEQTAA